MANGYCGEFLKKNGLAVSLEQDNSLPLILIFLARLLLWQFPHKSHISHFPICFVIANLNC